MLREGWVGKGMRKERKKGWGSGRVMKRRRKIGKRKSEIIKRERKGEKIENKGRKVCVKYFFLSLLTYLRNTSSRVLIQITRFQEVNHSQETP